MRRETSTDLNIVRKYPDRFTWGAIQEFYNFGRYTIAKTIDKDGSPAFHIWVENEWQDSNSSVCQSAGTLEYAILIAISFARIYDKAAKDGKRGICINTEDAYYAAKVLGLWDEL